MKKKIKIITKWTAIALLIFIVITIMGTFFCIDLPWTAQRASIAQLPDTYFYEYEEYGAHCVYDEERHTPMKLWEHFSKIDKIADVCGFELYKGVLGEDEESLIFSIEDSFYAKGILNLYAKWHNITIFYYFDS